MVALELAGEPALATRRAYAFLDRLELFAQAVSLGDVASLATHPATTTHELWTPEQRSALGVTDALVRLSVGVEDPDDLVADVRRALDAAAAVA
jgi:methionine-gamma-lyase